MKKFKALLSLIVITFVALVIYQNREYFLAKQALSLSLGVETWHWTAQEIANVYYFGVCLLIGLIITGYMGMCAKFRARKATKALNATINTHVHTIEALQTELDKFKSDPYFQKNDDTSDELTAENENIISELPETMDKA